MTKKGGVIDLLVHNYRKIQDLHITLVAGTNEITGPNGAGKSAGLNAVANIFGGKALTPANPIHEGETGFELQATLEDLGLLIRRIGTLDKKGQLKEELIVTNAEGVAAGVPLKRPQEILDRLLEGRSVALQSLLEMSKAEQIALLQQVTGLDFTALNAKRAQTYDARRNVNADVKRLSALLDGTPKYDDVPEEPVSVSDLMAELEKREVLNQINDETREEAEALKKKGSEALSYLSDLREQKAELEAKIDAKIDAHSKALKRLLDDDLEARDAVSQLVDADTDEIRQQIADADKINEQVRSNLARARLVKKHETAVHDATDLDTLLKEIDERKKEMLSGAKWPVEGMSFDENGVYLNGRTLEEASQVEQMEVDVGLAIARNPETKNLDLPTILLINKGSLYDRDHREELDRIAKENGVYVFFERVIDTLDEAKREGAAVYMENGIGINIGEEK